tara:strand:- start:1342 stop:1902 length:561 start_codon:yes stop_codon:yes gene_type:complete
MKITRKKLRQIILTEIFEKDAKYYQYVYDRDSTDPNHISGAMFEYEFQTDSGLKYTVSIYAPKDYFPEEDKSAFRGVWDVSFFAQDPNNPRRDAYGLTGENDMKVLNTIIQIVKDFVSNIRPTLPDPLSTFTHFKCEAQQERSRPGRPMGTDSRRGRIYQYMLKKQGISSQLSLDEYGNVIIEFEI